MAYRFAQPSLPREFAGAWRFALGLFAARSDDERVYMLRPSPYSPNGGQIAFRYANQLFFVYVETPEHDLPDGLRELLLSSAAEARAIPTDELVELSDWEIHDEAVTCVVRALEDAGQQILAAQSIRVVCPSIRYRDGDGEAGVIVRAARLPALHPAVDDEVRDLCRGLGDVMHLDFASVLCGATEDDFKRQDGSAGLLYRGREIKMTFGGLERVE